MVSKGERKSFSLAQMGYKLLLLCPVFSPVLLSCQFAQMSFAKCQEFIFSNDQSAMSLLFKTEYMPRVVVRLVNILNVLYMIEWSKTNEMLHVITPNGMLLVQFCISPKKTPPKIRIQKTSNFNKIDLRVSTMNIYIMLDK